MKKIRNKGFSLVEIMIALVVLSMVVAAFIPATTKKTDINEMAPRTSCVSRECNEYGPSCSLCDKCENICLICNLNCYKEEGNMKQDEQTCTCVNVIPE